jgi:hypothetical protein
MLAAVMAVGAKVMADDREPRRGTDCGEEAIHRQVRRTAPFLVEGTAIEAPACARTVTPREPPGCDAEKAPSARRPGRLPVAHRSGPARKVEGRSRDAPVALARLVLSSLRRREGLDQLEVGTIVEGPAGAGEGGTIAGLLDHGERYGAAAPALDGRCDPEPTRRRVERCARRLAPGHGTMVSGRRRCGFRIAERPIVGGTDLISAFLGPPVGLKRMPIRSWVRSSAFRFSVPKEGRGRGPEARLDDPGELEQLPALARRRPEHSQALARKEKRRVRDVTSTAGSCGPAWADDARPTRFEAIPASPGGSPHWGRSEALSKVEPRDLRPAGAERGREG